MQKQDPFGIESQGVHYLTGKLVGGYVSQQASAYLRLLTVYKRGTIQSVLQEMIEEWISRQEPEDKVIAELAERACLEWMRRRKKYPKWKEYENEVIDRLTKRKVDKEIIRKIRNKMRSRIGKDY